MAIPERVKTKMKEEGLKGVNKPKRTPNHKTKSHCVMAKEGDTYKFIRFGQQGVSGAGKNPTTAKDKARKKSYYARHNAQGKPTSKLSAKYWSHKVNGRGIKMSDVMDDKAKQKAMQEDVGVDNYTHDALKIKRGVDTGESYGDSLKYLNDKQIIDLIGIFERQKARLLGAQQAKSQKNTATKNRRGSNDYRSGGYVLNTTDNRKVKRNGK